MNVSFYLALDRLPMSLVAAMEFLSTILIALYGLRSGRNLLALALAATGVFVLIGLSWSSDLAGLGFAVLNAALFGVYIVLGHKAAEGGAGRGVETLGAAMAVAFIAAFPIGVSEVLAALSSPPLILAGIGVGLCSSVIPYVSRSARHVAAAARDLRADAGAAAGDGDRRRCGRAPADPVAQGHFRHRPGDGRCRAAQAAGGGEAPDDRYVRLRGL